MMLGASSDEIASEMRRHNIIPTRQRMIIARVLFGQHRHFSADLLMQEVNIDRAHVSKATVYNTLGLFARNGLVREVIVDPTRIFYDTNTLDHHHFYNIDTGELLDIEADYLAIKNMPVMPEGTVADGVDVIIRVRNDSAVS